MEYMGAIDYWFWLGIEHGYTLEYHVWGYKTDPFAFLEGRLGQPNKMSTDCLQAFKDGFSIGEELSENEYIELTTIIHPAKVEEVKIEPSDDKLVNVTITGSC